MRRVGRSVGQAMIKVLGGAFSPAKPGSLLTSVARVQGEYEYAGRDSANPTQTKNKSNQISNGKQSGKVDRSQVSWNVQADPKNHHIYPF